MMFIGDNLAQCKVGLVKDGGQAFCCRDKAKATLDTSNAKLARNDISMIEIGIKQAILPLKDQSLKWNMHCSCQRECTLKMQERLFYEMRDCQESQIL